MPKITGISELKRKLARLSKQHGTVEDVVVGFTQSYALYVHEIPARHVVGNMHYLIGPARRLKRELGNIVEETTANTFSLQNGLLTAGRRLQREAQNEVPVDTGALKASSFTAKESELNAASAAAYAAGNTKRGNTKADRRAAAANKRTKARKKKRGRK
jgi:hypothetical protein